LYLILVEYFDMKREALTAEKRTILGKRVKHLRREGILPANMFGKGIKSTSLQLPLKDFEKVYNEVHETGLVDLTVAGETHPVLIQNIHIQSITHTPLHADFFKVNLKEKVRASVPIIAVGEPKAVTDKIGVLLQPLSEVEVEALPTDLPEHIEVNIEKLANIGDSISIEDIKIPAGVEVLADASEMVFRIDELVSEEAEELAAEEEAAAEAASEATEGEVKEGEAAEGEGAPTETEGQAPAEGETKDSSEKPE
jgi:large subunit ribosomal protein L25